MKMLHDPATCYACWWLNHGRGNDGRQVARPPRFSEPVLNDVLEEVAE